MESEQIISEERIVVGEEFDTFDEFEKCFNLWQEINKVVFVKKRIQKIDTSNTNIKNPEKHYPAEHIYRYVFTF